MKLLRALAEGTPVWAFCLLRLKGKQQHLSNSGVRSGMNDLIYRKDKDLDPHIIYCWEKALSAYPELWNNRLYLHSRNLRDMTMRAQPVVNALFFFKKWH